MFQYQISDRDTEYRYSNQAEATILSILDDDSTIDYSSKQRTNTHPLSSNVNNNTLSAKNQQYLFAPIQSTPLHPVPSLPSYHHEKNAVAETTTTTTTAVSSADIDSYFTYNNTDHTSSNTSSTTDFTRPKAITMSDLTFSFDINTNNHTIHNTHNKLHRQTLLKKSESDYTTSSETTTADNSFFHSTASPTSYLTSTHSSFYFPTSTLTPTITATTSTLPQQPLSSHTSTTKHTTTFNNTILNTTTTTHNTLINPLSLNRDDFPHNYTSPLTNTNTYTMNNTYANNTSLNTSVNPSIDNFSPTAYGLKSLYTDKNTTNTYQTTYPKQSKQTNHNSNLMKKGIINFGSQCNPSEKLGACSWCVADEYG